MRFYYQSEVALSTEEIIHKLEGLDYEEIKDLGEGVFEAEHVGRFSPEIIPDPAPQYGSLVKEERENYGLSREIFADLLLISDQHLRRVEEGTAFLGESQIKMAASVLGLDPWFLQYGAKKEEFSVEQVRDALQRLWQKMDGFQRLQEEVLKVIFRMSEGMRFQPQRVREEEDIFYQIYDTKKGDFVRDSTGEIIGYTSANEAYTTAKQMEGLSARIEPDVTLQEKKQIALGKKIDRLIYHLDPWAYHNAVKDYAAQEEAVVCMVKENNIVSLMDGLLSFEISGKDWMILNGIIEDYNEISPDQNRLIRLADPAEKEVVLAYGSPDNLFHVSLQNEQDIFAALDDAKMQPLGDIQVSVDIDKVDVTYSMRDHSFEIMPVLTESMDEFGPMGTRDFPDPEESIGAEKDGDMITVYDTESIDEDGMPQILMKSDVNGRIYYQADLNPERQKQVTDVFRKKAGFHDRLDETILAEETEERREGLFTQEANSDQLNIRK